MTISSFWLVERLVNFLHVDASLVPEFPSLVDTDMLRIILVSDKVIRHGREMVSYFGKWYISTQNIKVDEIGNKFQCWLLRLY